MGTVSNTIEKASEKLREAIPQDMREGKATKWVENYTARVPSMGFLGLAIGSMALSAGLAVAGKRELANFVGLWAPSLLLIGVYNKLVKLQGSD